MEECGSPRGQSIRWSLTPNFGDATTRARALILFPKPGWLSGDEDDLKVDVEASPAQGMEAIK